MRDLLSLIEGAQWANLKTIPAGTILYHGTDDDEYDPADIKGPAWFSDDNNVAAHFVNGGRLLSYRTKADIKLPIIKDMREMNDFCEKFNIDRSSSEDIRDSARKSGIAGWIIPDNYEPGDDILICDLSSLAPMVSELSDLHEEAEEDVLEAEGIVEDDDNFLPAPVMAPINDLDEDVETHHVYGQWPRVLNDNRAIADYVDSISPDEVSVEQIEDEYIGYKAVLKLLPIESIKEGHPDGNVRSPAKEKRYAKMDLAKQPPIMVQEWDMVVVDGNHRFRVAKAAGVTDMLCYVVCDEDTPIAESIEPLEEKNLPLMKGLMPQVRGNYGALICVMRPEDFIRLTVSNDEEFEKIFNDEFVSLDDYKSKSHPEYNVDQYFLPRLYVIQSTGKVTGHEGRHRAAMVAKAGGTSFPCSIIFKSEPSYILSYEREEMDGGSESITQTERLRTRGDCLARQDELRSAMLGDDDHPYWYGDWKIECVDSGGTMKGSPRSDIENWKHDAWTVEDMPPELIGQFNPSVRVPSSRMKVGLVKGYNHFK